MKVFIVLCLFLAIAKGGVVINKTEGESSSVKPNTSEEVDLVNEPVELSSDDGMTTLGTTKTPEKETTNDEKLVKKDEKPTKDGDKAHKHDDKSHKHDLPQKPGFKELEEELKKITKEESTTTKATTPAPKKKSSKNSGVKNDMRLYIVFTSFFMFLITVVF